MTEKQTTTLVLFAQNFSLPVIAKRMRVSLTTIRERIKTLSKNHSIEFNNALGVRESYKRTRDALRDPENLEKALNKRTANPSTHDWGMSIYDNDDNKNKNIVEIF